MRYYNTVILGAVIHAAGKPHCRALDPCRAEPENARTV